MTVVDFDLPQPEFPIAYWLPGGWFLTVHLSGWNIYNPSYHLVHSFQLSTPLTTLVTISDSNQLYILDVNRLIIVKDFLHDVYISINFPRVFSTPFQACFYQGFLTFSTSNGVWQYLNDNNFKQLLSTKTQVYGLATLQDGTLCYVTTYTAPSSDTGSLHTIMTELWRYSPSKPLRRLIAYSTAHPYLYISDPFTIYAPQSISPNRDLNTVVNSAGQYYYSLRDRTQRSTYMPTTYGQTVINKLAQWCTSPFNAPIITFDSADTLLLYNSPMALTSMDFAKLFG